MNVEGSEGIKSECRPNSHTLLCLYNIELHLIMDIQVLEKVQQRATRCNDECKGVQ